MSVLALGLVLFMWAAEGTHMITPGTVMLFAAMVIAGLLIDLAMVFGPAEDEPGTDRLLRDRSRRPARVQRDLPTSVVASRPRLLPPATAAPAAERSIGHRRHLPEPVGQFSHRAAA